MPIAGSWTRVAINTMQGFRPDLGPPLLRRLTTGKSYKCSGSFLLTQAHVVALKSFYRADCSFGELPFSWLDPEDGVTPRVWEFQSIPQPQHVTGGIYRAAVYLIRKS